MVRNFLNLGLSGLALLSGIDEAAEALFSVANMFNLDTHHGILSLSIMGVIKSVFDTSDYFRAAKSS
tara:strand:- start:74 stop:274 length:201 start_codon:yes stop_codon:yes gene_type:complete